LSRIKNVMLVQPKSTGGNFEYVAIFRQGMLFLSAALKQHKGPFVYDRQIWFEDRCGHLDPDKDLEGVDLLLVSALINEAPRGYELARQAKRFHPNIKTVGGGPHMGPLVEEAIGAGDFDVIVQREGEDVIGPLGDALLSLEGHHLNEALHRIPSISFMEDGHLVRIPRRGTIPADYVELPDYGAVRGLTTRNPMAAGVMETVRGCTEKCTYCEVIQQFLGYRMVKRETEWKRLEQLQQLAADGLIYRSPMDGRFAVFVSDDLHPPTLRATKYRGERMERIKGWHGRTEGMFMMCQTRAELGQDPEMAAMLRQNHMEMLYAGVESSSAENLKAVNKRQDPSQVHKDLVALNSVGFTVVAMTIIGLPYDTEETIMDMAQWVKTVSRYQTANLLTPLPATSNWDLEPLDAEGNLLAPGEMRPYHLYTGKQFVHKDHRWGMAESRAIYDRYYDRLRPVDKLYERLFRQIRARGDGAPVKIINGDAAPLARERVQVRV